MVGLFIVMAASTSLGVGESLTAEAELNRYTPIDGGFQIRISEGGAPSISAEHMTIHGSFDFAIKRFVPRDFYERMTRGHVQQGDGRLRRQRVRAYHGETK